MSSFSQILKRFDSEGVLALWVSPRSNSWLDQSSNANTVTVTGGVYTNTQRGRAHINLGSGSIVVNNSDAIHINEGILIVFGEFEKQATNSRWFWKRGATTDYDFYRVNSTSIGLYDGNASNSATFDFTNLRMAAAKFKQGDAVKYYKNGALHVTASGTFNQNGVTGNLYLGSDSSAGSKSLMPTHEYIILNDASISDQEISELYDAYMESVGVLEKPRMNFVYPDLTQEADSSLLVHYDGYTMTPDGEMADLSGNGRHGEMLGKMEFGKGLTSRAFRNTRTSTIKIANPVTSEATFSIWINSEGDANNQFLFSIVESTSNQWGPFIDASNQINLFNDIDNAGAIIYPKTVPLNNWLHVVVEQVANENILYVNGELIGSGTSSSDDLGSINGSLYVTSRGDNLAVDTSASCLRGRFYDFKCFSEGKGVDWVKAEYEKGAKLLKQQDDLSDVPPTLDDVSSGRIGRSSFIHNNRFFGIKESDGNKYIQGIFTAANKKAYIFQNKAYGSFIYEVEKGEDDNTIVVVFASDSIGNSAIGNNYNFTITSTGNVLLRRGNVDIFATATGYITGSAKKIKIAITRDFTGKFTAYIKGGAYTNWQLINVTGGTGTNPVIDATYTSSTYANIEIDEGDRFRLLGIHEGVLSLEDLQTIYT